MRWLKDLVRMLRPLPSPRPAPCVKTSAHIEEQTIPGYRPDRFFPMQLWKTYYRGRYRVVTKLGFGVTSTVWLARDNSRWARPRYVALKILVRDIAPEDAYREYVTSDRITNTDPSHPGARCICPALRAFELGVAHGWHVCFVYEPMRETLPTLEQHLSGRLSSDMVKELLRVLLRALDYLHVQCGVIHTDIKKDNIFLSIRDMSIVDDLARQEAEDPLPRILDGEYTVYLSRDFEGIKGLGPPKLGDFRHAVVHDEDSRDYPIQPDALRAPEVILGIPWTYSVDIWNLGVLAWEFFEMDPLFRGLDSQKQCYTHEFHLAEMIALLGHPPRNLLSRGTNTTTYFAPTGAFRGVTLEHQDLKSRMRDTPTEERAGFASFVEKTLQWRPGDRPSAAELLDDPWVQSGHHSTG